MTFYIIAKSDDELLNSPVFYAGSGGSDEAITVFTTKRLAQNYIDAAHWNDVETVVEITPLDMLRWLLTAVDNDSTVLAVNPRYDTQSRLPQPTISIPGLLQELTRTVEDQVHAPAPLAARIITLDMLHCQKCGKVIEQRAGKSPQECCGEPMSIAARTALENYASAN